jgi:polyphosphate kinase
MTKDKLEQHKGDAAGAPTAVCNKVDEAQYLKELAKLQIELCHLQQWVRASGERIVIVFEGRDGAGKGGTIRAITSCLSPRVVQSVALPAPSDRERTQLYVQRYIQHFPAAGEVVIFDRSWYNRAGVERVMGFCTEEQYSRFIELCPLFEKTIVENGVRLLKYWLEVSNEEQKRRFQARIEDPLQQWKLSKIDLPSRERWYDYSRARDEMLELTDTQWAPWHIVDMNDKRRARLNVIAHVLSQIPYEKVPCSKIILPERDETTRYDDLVPLRQRRWIPERF